MIPPVARLLPDGRLHLQHGPIDLVVEAAPEKAASPHPDAVAESGSSRGRHAEERPEAASRSTYDADRASFETPAARAPQDDAAGSFLKISTIIGRKRHEALHPDVARAYRAAARRFETILPELCEELPALRKATRAGRLRGSIARRMEAATLPHAANAFITPMAAVAGAVAEAVLAAMLEAAELRRASVNNGGDIALHLAPGERLRIGLVDHPDAPSLFGTTTIVAEDEVGGVATSGWRGRSFSLGIADAVTILAASAAEADAAATVVANAVDLPGHPAILRRPACEVQHDSDLGARLVTRAVGPLAAAEIEAALGAGRAKAEALVARGLIRAAALHLQGRTMTSGILAASGFPRRRHAEEAGLPGRLEARTTRGACFETRPFGPLLSMTPFGDQREAARKVSA